MSIKTNYNGGFEQGILEIMEKENLLSLKDKKRLQFLKSLDQKINIEIVCRKKDQTMNKKTFLFTCDICNKQWQRTFNNKDDITKYLQLRDTCPAGYHIAEPSLQNHVTYKEVKI